MSRGLLACFALVTGVNLISEDAWFLSSVGAALLGLFVYLVLDADH